MDDQYALEVARAQRGNGFIAGDVSDNGELLAPGVDPSYLNAPSSDYRAAATLAAAITRRREEDARAEMRARQFKAQQDFKSLVAGGVAPEMALRKVAVDLVPPAQLSSTIRGTTPTPDQFNARPIMGEDGSVLGQAVPTQGGGMHMIPQATQAQPLEVRASQKIIGDQMSETRRGLDRAMKDMENEFGQRKTDAARRANIYRTQLDELQQQYQQGSTNFTRSGASPARPQQAASETVVVTKGGRRYELPKSQLDEAEREGYSVER